MITVSVHEKGVKAVRVVNRNDKPTPGNVSNLFNLNSNSRFGIRLLCGRSSQDQLKNLHSDASSVEPGSIVNKLLVDILVKHILGDQQPTSKL